MSRAPAYSGDYSVEFKRLHAGRSMEALQLEPPVAAGVTASTTEQGRVGDWTVERLTEVAAGEFNTLTGLNPDTSYQMRWVAVGRDDDDTTPGPPETFSTNPHRRGCQTRNGGADYVGENVYSLDGSHQAMVQEHLRFSHSNKITCTNYDASSFTFSLLTWC